MTQIPDEDSITKTQLWKRTDDAIGISNSIKDELYPQILQTKSNTVDEVKKLMDQQQKDLQEIQNQLNPKFLEFKKEMLDFISEMVNKIQVAYNDRIKVMEAGNRILMENTETEIEKRTKFYMDVMQEKLVSLEKQFTDLQKDVDRSITQYQLTLLSKFSELNNKVGQLMENMKQFSDWLRK